jgi:hypothetical protein
VVHERSGSIDFSTSRDGLGIPGNPKRLSGKPELSQSEVMIGKGIARVSVTLLYRKTLLSFAPI